MTKPVSEKMVRAFVIIGSSILMVIIFHYTFIYLFPFLLAMMIAFLLDPLVTTMEKKLSRGLSTSIVLLSFLGLFLISSYIIIIKFIGELGNIMESIPFILGRLKEIFFTFAQKFFHKISSFFPSITEWQFETYIDQLLDNLGTFSIGLLTNIIQISSGTLDSLSYSIFSFIFIVLAVFMLTKDLHLVKQVTVKIIPQKINYYFSPVFDHVKKAFIGFIKAQIIITIITSILFLIGLVFFRVEHALAITITIFFVDFIPYVGIGLILIPWIGYLFLTGQYVITIEITILYIVIIIVRQFLEPRLLASTIGIHPFIALSVLFISFQTLGIAGVIMTPFILISVSAFHQAGVFHALWRYINDI